MKPKKSLGQNFLRDKAVLDKIIKSANLSPDDLVIEIGPGEGILTEKLAGHAKKVIAIEIDGGLAEKLQKKYRSHSQIQIINDDVLKINLPELIDSQDMPANRYKVIANIPYYITSPIIQLFLETKCPPAEMVFMVQKEVAKRITAKPGQMSILAISVQYYATAKLLFYVEKKCFWPVPKVDSAVIKITPLPSPVSSTRHPLPITGEEDNETKKFFRVVKAGFSAKRKMLANNLTNGLHLEKKLVEEKLKTASLEKTVRAQELDVNDWKKLAGLFNR